MPEIKPKICDNFIRRAVMDRMRSFIERRNKYLKAGLQKTDADKMAWKTEKMDNVFFDEA